MAHLVDCDEEGGNTQPLNDSELVEWLKSNHLTKLIPMFMNENMTLEELIQFSDDREIFKQYLEDLKIPKPSIWRIISALKRIKSKTAPQNKKNENEERKIDDSQNNDNNKSKKHYAVLTEQEDKAMDKIRKYNQHLSLLIKELNTFNESVINNEQQMKSEINAQFNNLINVVSNKQEDVLNKLQKLSKQKAVEINAKTQQMEEKQKNAMDALSKCYEVIENGNIDREQRKKTIISTSNNIVNDRVPSDINNISTTFVISVNKQSTEAFVENLPNIYDEKEAKCKTEEENARLLRIEKEKQSRLKALAAKQKELDTKTIELEKAKRQIEEDRIGVSELKQQQQRKLLEKQKELNAQEKQLTEAHRTIEEDRIRVSKLEQQQQTKLNAKEKQLTEAHRTIERERDNLAFITAQCKELQDKQRKLEQEIEQYEENEQKMSFVDGKSEMEGQAELQDIKIIMGDNIEDSYDNFLNIVSDYLHSLLPKHYVPSAVSIKKDGKDINYHDTVEQAGVVNNDILQVTIDTNKNIQADSQILIKTVTGKTIPCHVNVNYTITDVKYLIYMKEKIPHNHQTLIYAGKLLEDNKTLDDYKIKSGATLHLVSRLSVKLDHLKKIFSHTPFRLSP